MIKNLLLLLVATALISGCATMYEKPDPLVGQWMFKFSDFPRGDPNGILTISKEEGVYSGTIANSTGEYELNELSIETNNSLGANFDYQNNTVEFSAVFDGAAVTGQTNARNRTFDFAGEKVE